MKKYLFIIALLATVTASAQIYMGESKTLQLPSSTENDMYGGYAPSLFIRYYISDGVRHATCVISIPSYEKNIDISKNNTVVLVYENSSDTTKVLTVEKHYVNILELTTAEFSLDHYNIFHTPLLAIIIQQNERPDYRIDIKRSQRTLLPERLRELLTQAKENVEKIKSGEERVHKNTPDYLAERHVPTLTNKRKIKIIEDFSIGFTMGAIEVYEAVYEAAYGAYLSLFGLYADFRIVPIEKPLRHNTSLYQFNAGYRIQVYKGLGITPLIGMVKYKALNIDNGKDFNYGGMIDYTFLNRTRTYGIKIGAFWQRYSHGVSIGMTYNL